MMQNPYKRSSSHGRDGETTRTTVMENPYRSRNSSLQCNNNVASSPRRTVIMENPYKKSSPHRKMIENPYKRSGNARSSMFAAATTASSKTTSYNNNYRIVSQDYDTTHTSNTNTATRGHENEYYDKFCSSDEFLCRNLDQFEREHSNYDEFDKYCLPDHILCEMMDEFEKDGLVYDSYTAISRNRSQNQRCQDERPRKRSLSPSHDEKSLQAASMELPSEKVRRRPQQPRSPSPSARHPHPETAIISPSPPTKKQMNNYSLQANDDSPVKPKNLSQQYFSSLESASKGKDDDDVPSSLTQMIDKDSANVLPFLSAEQNQLVQLIMIMRRNLEVYVNQLFRKLQKPQPDRLIDRIDALGVAAAATTTTEGASGIQLGCNEGINGGNGGGNSGTDGCGVKSILSREFMVAMHKLREYGNIALHGPYHQLPNHNEYERAVANYCALKNQHEKEHGCPNTEELHLV